MCPCLGHNAWTLCPSTACPMQASCWASAALAPASKNKIARPHEAPPPVRARSLHWAGAAQAWEQSASNLHFDKKLEYINRNQAKLTKHRSCVVLFGIIKCFASSPSPLDPKQGCADACAPRHMHAPRRLRYLSGASDVIPQSFPIIHIPSYRPLRVVAMLCCTLLGPTPGRPRHLS